MKRNEFKLLLEDWKRNFIVESPEIGPEDVDFFADDGEMDQDGIENMDVIDMDSDLNSEEEIHSIPSFDTHSQQSLGMYPGDNDLDSAELDYDYSSMAGSEEVLLSDLLDDSGF